MSDSILQVNQIKDKGGNATGITVADTTANVTVGNLTATTAAINGGSIGSSVTGNWGWKLLQTVTASGSDTTLTIGNATHLSSTYSTYKIIMEDFVMPTSHALLAEFLIGGSLKQGNNYDYNVWGYNSANSARKVQASTQQTYMYITPIAFGPGNTDNTGINGEFTLTLPSLTRWHGIRWTIDYNDNDNYAITAIGTGGHRRHRITGDKGALTGIRFKSNNSSSNITRGTLRLYGVINA